MLQGDIIKMGNNSIYGDIKEKYSFLLDEHKKSNEQENIEKLAFSAVEKLVEKGSISEPQEVIEKLSEFRNNSVEELKILNKAIELGRDTTSDDIKLGSLAEEKPAFPESAEDKFNNFLLSD
jgi:hypothetical protein